MLPSIVAFVIVGSSLLAEFPVRGFGGHPIDVRGQFICPSDPAALTSAKVYIYDKKMLRFDTKMAQAVADATGKFQLNGQDKRWILNGDPHLHIYHHCKKGMLHLCPVHLDFELKHAETDKPIDVGIMNLEMNPFSRSHACM